MPLLLFTTEDIFDKNPFMVSTLDTCEMTAKEMVEEQLQILLPFAFTSRYLNSHLLKTDRFERLELKDCVHTRFFSEYAWLKCKPAAKGRAFRTPLIILGSCFV